MPGADRPLAGRRALVTGASSGIGAAIAERLAARGAGIVLTARRADRLRGAADQLAVAHGVAVETIACDLGRPDGAATVWRDATAGGTVDILVNNAGFGYFRPFTTAEWSRDAELLQLNITSLVELCHHFIAHHRGRSEPAHVLNVASTTAFQPVPNFAVYASSKAFVRYFSEALHHEVKGTNLSITCLCPGSTTTEFHAAAGAGNYGRLANASMLPAADVAEAGVKAMLRGKRTLVTGFMNKLSCSLVKLLPSGLAAKSAMWVMGRPRSAALPARGTGET